MWGDGDTRRSSHFCRLPCKPHIRRELIPTTVPHSGTRELQENGTTLCRRHRSAMPNNGDVPSDRRTALRSQRNPIASPDQAAGFKTAPSGTTPSMTNLHSAISSFRARATTIGCLGMDPTKPKLGQIEFFDEDIDHANRIVLADPVFQAFRKQRRLDPGQSPQRSASSDPPANRTRILSRESKQAMRFYTGWVIRDRVEPAPRSRRRGMSLNALRGALCLDCVAAALKNHLVFFLQNFSENIPTVRPIIDPIITTSIAAHT